MLEGIKQKSYRIKEGIEQTLREQEAGKSKKELLSGVFNEKGKYKKLLSLLKLIKTSLPVNIKLTEGTLKKLFYNTDNLPFSPEKFRFEEMNLGDGNQVRVYLLKSKTGKNSFAIKVFRPENSSEDIANLATKLRQERNNLEKLYSSIQNLIPEEHYIIMEDPFKSGRPAIVIIEEFIGEELLDIFLIPSKELKKLTLENPEFKNQLTEFIKITLQNEKDNDELADIFGPKNLSIIKTNDGSIRLILIDPHGYKKKKEATKEEWEATREKLNLLKEILILIEA